MRYCGSKRRFMKYLLPILTRDLDSQTRFVDLFGGGMNVICEIPISNKIAVDYNKYMIALWQELQVNGLVNIPSFLTEEEYVDIKKAYINNNGKYENYLIGYVGSCCSYGGAWFNGYAKFNYSKNEDHIKEAYNGLKKHIDNFKFLEQTSFIYSSYEQINLTKNDIVYCDIPYRATKRYETDFDHDRFWKWARETNKKVKHLYVSEYDAPSDFHCIWNMEKKDGMGKKKGQKQAIKIEKLFEYNSKEL